ncbi:MAG: GHKL domain-containing protein [Thermodesulfobacteriota bacterium]
MPENFPWETWIPFYLQNYAGQKIPGITHNLNNYVHILDMQLSLLNSKTQSKPDSPISDYRSRIQKVNENTGNLMHFMQLNSNWSFYSQKERIQTSIPDFIDWLVTFWDNDLYCKHKITIDTELGDNLPNLDLPAYTLTFCMEQPLANAVEACRVKDAEQEQNIAIRAAAQKNGVLFHLTSPTILEVDDKDAWNSGTTSKKGHLGLGLYLVRAVCRDLGWEAKIWEDHEATNYELLIPEKKTTPKTES